MSVSRDTQNLHDVPKLVIAGSGVTVDRTAGKNASQVCGWQDRPPHVPRLRSFFLSAARQDRLSHRRQQRLFQSSQCLPVPHTTVLLSRVRSSVLLWIKGNFDHRVIPLTVTPDCTHLHPFHPVTFTRTTHAAPQLSLLHPDSTADKSEQMYPHTLTITLLLIRRQEQVTLWGGLFGLLALIAAIVFCRRSDTSFDLCAICTCSCFRCRSNKIASSHDAARNLRPDFSHQNGHPVSKETIF